MHFKILFLSLVALVQFYNVNATLSPAIMLVKQKAGEALEQQDKSLILGGYNNWCYSYYSKVLKNLLDTLESDTQRCDRNESSELANLHGAEQKSRNATTKSLNAICAVIDECEAESENLNFFDCVHTSGDKNSHGIWKASKDSFEIAALIRNKIEAIKFEAKRCSSDAEQAYIVGATKTTDDIKACYAKRNEIST